MNKVSKRIRFLAGVSVALVATAAPLTAQESAAHRHMGHVADGFSNTPEGQGLLPTALAEAAVARQHAEFALRNPSDLASVQRHAGHVLHAIDPSRIDGGPGAGYGVVRAASGISQHIDMAGADESASENISTHAPHVSAAATGAVGRAERAAELAEAILASGSADEAAELLNQLSEALDAMVEGHDANGDGRIGWQSEEGGLAQAERHMALMKRGEGMEG
jgi:hypothetical protein